MRAARKAALINLFHVERFYLSGFWFHVDFLSSEFHQQNIDVGR